MKKNIVASGICGIMSIVCFLILGAFAQQLNETFRFILGYSGLIATAAASLIVLFDVTNE